MPDIPTLAEAGLPGYESYVWYALLAPKGTPKPVIDTWRGVIQKAGIEPEE